MAAIGTNEASGDTVYAAIELSKKNWVIGIARPERERPSIHRLAGGNLQELVARLRTAAKGGRRILVCYEAGYDGFWIARSLATENIECRVLDPASIQVNRRARRVRTDRIDVMALLRALIAIDRGERHVCAVVRVPSIEEEDARRPIANVSVSFVSAPAISTGSKAFCSLRAFGGLSRSGVAPGSTSRRYGPQKVNHCLAAFVAGWSGNMRASS